MGHGGWGGTGCVGWVWACVCERVRGAETCIFRMIYLFYLHVCTCLYRLCGFMYVCVPLSVCIIQCVVYLFFILSCVYVAAEKIPLEKTVVFD